MKRPSHKTHNVRGWVIFFFTLILLQVEMIVVKAKKIVAPGPSGSIMGRVVDPRNNPITGVEVRTPGQPAVLTNGKGEFDIRGLAATERLAVSFSAPGFMDTTRIYKVRVSSRITGNVVVIWPRATPMSLDATQGGKLTFPGGTISFPPRALVDERGRQLRGKVRVAFSALDVSDRRQIRSVPGDFTARMRNKTIRQLETFGVFEVFLEDSNGRRVNLAKGRKAAVELSIPPARRRTTPNVVGLFSFDRNSGRWIEEGTLRPTPGRVSFISFVPNLMTSWNADMPLDTTCITLKILNEDGTSAPVGTRVEAEGVDYSGTSPTGYVINSMGEVCLSVKRCPGTVRVVAYDQNNSAISSCPVRIQTPCQIASAADCGNPTNCPLQPEEIILPGSTPGTFYHDMNAHDPANWDVRTGTNYIPADPNNDFYNVYWLSDSNHIDWVGGIMSLRLDNIPPPPHPAPSPQYNSAEYRTKATYGYGTYEVCLRAAKGNGLMTSFFTYTGGSETPPTQHNEIDIEFRGQNTWELWTNFYCDDSDTGHESTVPLGFDAAEEFHRYKFVWTPSDVKWYVDGQYVPTPNTGSHPCTSPTVLGKIMVNLWSGNSNSNTWLGIFTYPGTPISAEYDWIRYKP